MGKKYELLSLNPYIELKFQVGRFW